MLLEGHSIEKISKGTGVTRKTIRKWKSLDVLHPKRSSKMTNMHLYDEEVRKTVDENCRIETKEVLKKITEMGYKGSKSTGYENISRLRGRETKNYEPRLFSVFWVPPKSSNLFYIDRRCLSKKEKDLVDNLCRESIEI